MVIPDKDIIESSNIYDYGMCEMLEANMNWLIRNLARALLARRENLKKAKPGAAPKQLPPIIWVKMLSRPHSSDQHYKAIWTQRSKFNQVIDQVLGIEHYMSHVSVNSLTDVKYFDASGKLTVTGQYKFWRELDDIFKNYITSELSTEARRSVTYHSHDPYHW